MAGFYHRVKGGERSNRYYLWFEMKSRCQRTCAGKVTALCVTSNHTDLLIGLRWDYSPGFVKKRKFDRSPFALRTCNWTVRPALMRFAAFLANRI